MRKPHLLAAACLALTSGLLVLAKPPATQPAAAGDDSMMSDTMMSDSMTSMSSMSGAAHAPASKLTKTQLEFFETKVRPVLVNSCYKCHSAEAHKTKGGLALDTLAGWQKGGEDGKVIVPGYPEKSMLIKAISYTDNDLQMPPDDKKLSDADIATLTQWVRMGAPDPRVPTAASKLSGLTDKARGHWAYKPVKNPPIPNVHDTTWVKNPVDFFVLDKLEKNDLKPSPPATREALIRRASYDLIGLPPTPEEVEAFVHDTSPDAFEKVVDRLLASPHFGERWGRYWLDTARYSDTSGADQNRGEYKFPYAWTYRDYVINSFNSDKPYDQFLQEQLAADLLPVSARDPSRLAALGFLTIGKRFQNPNDTIDERIDAVGKGMLGMTIACARCHDHKFDPIPQADYYSLHGVFNSITEPVEKPLIAKPAKDEDYLDFQNQLTKLENNNRDLYYSLIENKAREFRKDAAAYVTVGVIGRRNNADEINLRNKVIAEHKLDRDVYQYSGRYIHGNPQVFGPLIELAQVPADQFAGAVRRVYEQLKSGTIRKKAINPFVVKAFAAVPPDSLHSLQDVADVYGKLFADLTPAADNYLKACRTATKSGPVPGFDPQAVELFDLPAKIEVAADLTTDRLTEIAGSLPVVNGQGYNRLNLTEINQLFLTHPGSPARAMVVEDMPKPRNSYVFIRGEANNHGPVAPRQFLEILSGPNRKPFTSKGSGRLELAQAITSKSNPITARVMVNRIWMHLFGQGFVRTADDLGVQCENPSHPELLDYLAHRFMYNGNWSVKQMIRLVMLSNTYQQSCDTNPSYAARDSENRLLWRANLRRLDFEAIRDSMLMFTGTLDPKLGGKPVNLTDEPYSNRRSVYGYIDRGTVPELLSQFDFADPDMANSRRTSTIVPQQALFFMNSPMAVDVARKVTTRPDFLAATDPAARVAVLYSVLYQRTPSDTEIQSALDFIEAAGADDSSAATTQPLTPSQQRKTKAAQERRARQQQAIEDQIRKQAKGKAGMRAPIRNHDGTIVERRPLTPWEQYAQALLFTNEIAYEN